MESVNTINQLSSSNGIMSLDELRALLFLTIKGSANVGSNMEVHNAAASDASEQVRDGMNFVA